MKTLNQIREQIKGWKHAHADIAKHRAQQAGEGKEWHTVSITKKGDVNKMDTKKPHSSEEDARAHIANIKSMNPHLQNRKAYRLFKNHVPVEDI